MFIIIYSLIYDSIFTVLIAKKFWLMAQMLAPVFMVVAIDFRRNRFQTADLEGHCRLGLKCLNVYSGTEIASLHGYFDPPSGHH
jgi:hypothetical protein